jgi:hypothetical protein
MFCCADQEGRPTAGVPALHAATTKALATALEHLAAPRHIGLVVYLPMLALCTVRGAPLHQLSAAASSITQS